MVTCVEKVSAGYAARVRDGFWLVVPVLTDLDAADPNLRLDKADREKEDGKPIVDKSVYFDLLSKHAMGDQWCNDVRTGASAQEQDAP